MNAHDLQEKYPLPDKYRWWVPTRDGSLYDSIAVGSIAVGIRESVGCEFGWWWLWYSAPQKIILADHPESNHPRTVCEVPPDMPIDDIAALMYHHFLFTYPAANEEP